MKKKLVVLTGAGISAESGLSTFRDSNGLWENHSIYEVATPEAWNNNPELVNRFYNERRKQLLEVEPNLGHLGLVELENDYEVNIITQNVDDLHERAGSKSILHLHGELKKVRSTIDENWVKPLVGWELKMGDLCPHGSQLRPHIVWFGEDVPLFSAAIEIVKDADVFVVIGTSLNVYPAASLNSYLDPNIPIYIIDPQKVNTESNENVIRIQKKATEGVSELIQLINCT